MNQQSPSIPKEVEAHYLETKESERLSGVHGELERLRTLEIRHLYFLDHILFHV